MFENVSFPVAVVIIVISAGALYFLRPVLLWYNGTSTLIKLLEEQNALLKSGSSKPKSSVEEIATHDAEHSES